MVFFMDFDCIVFGVDGMFLVMFFNKLDDVLDDLFMVGFYYMVFLMFDCKELGCWLIIVYVNGVFFIGFVDYLVLEVFYLDDLEGNGVEVYVDWLYEGWRWNMDG